MTWPEAVAAFMLECEARALSPNTIDGYARALRYFGEWYHSQTGRAPEPAGVAPHEVGQWRGHMQAEGRRPATVNQRLASLKSFYSWAVEAGLAGFDPSRRVRRIPDPRGAPRAATADVVAAVLGAAQAAGNIRDVALITLLCQAGLRIGEALKLTWSDMSMERGAAWVLVRGGKGGKWRQVPLSEAARRGLLQLRAAGPQFAGGVVFRSEHAGKRGRGKALTTRGAWQQLRLYSEQAHLKGEKRITPHMLRHTFCKSLVDAGVSLDRVAALAGHASIAMTVRYTLPTEQDLRDAVQHLPPPGHDPRRERSKRGLHG